MSAARRILVLGAAGRDFHDFNVAFRTDPTVEVVAFTATQIPGIADRRYPAALAGPRYPDGIPIVPENALERLVHELGVDEVVLSYSDLAHVDVMHLASRVLASGAAFRLLSPRATMLRAHCPVVAICAVRTGCGKSQISRRLATHLREKAVDVAVVRHPMPYGDLERQRTQRFASLADLDAERDNITFEEREEYEAHVAAGIVVHAGVDYGEILTAAEREAKVIVWDGGNNDLPFFEPDLWITVTDPHRAGHETSYHPGESNFRAADIIVVNKIDSAVASDIERIRKSARAMNPRAEVVLTRSRVTVDHPDLVRGKRVVLVDDGPTLTHGGMGWGAGRIAAERFGAAAVVDPRPFAVGSIAAAYAAYPDLGATIPAMGYYPAQIRDLAETLRRVECDAIIVATPIDLRRLVEIEKPSTRARYEVDPEDAAPLAAAVDRMLADPRRRPRFEREPA